MSTLRSYIDARVESNYLAAEKTVAPLWQQLADAVVSGRSEEAAQLFRKIHGAECRLQVVRACRDKRRS